MVQNMEAIEMRRIKKRLLILFALVAGLSLQGCDIFEEPDDFILDGPPNYNLPHVDPHDGVFVNEHGAMTFKKNGKSVTLDIDGMVAGDTGLPEGATDAVYYFYNPVVPTGYECEYNEAHEMHFVIGGDNIKVEVGQVTEDGAFHTGVNQTTADRITLFGNGLESYYDFVLTEPGEEEPDQSLEDNGAEEPEEKTDEEVQNVLYEQYYDIISSLDDKWDQFMLVYFDGDDLPEVFVSSSELDMNDLKEYLLIARSRAGAEVNDDLRDGVAGAGGYRGDLYYVPQKGILYENTYSAPCNNPSDYIYLLDDGRLTLYASGRTEVMDDYEGPDDIDHMTWFWNDKEITPEEYEKKLNEETMNLSGDALSSLSYVDRESILNKLAETIN